MERICAGPSGIKTVESGVWRNPWAGLRVVHNEGVLLVREPQTGTGAQTSGAA